MEQSDLPTTQELPSGHKLNGTTAYLKQMSVFTTVDISPPELKKIAQERLDALLLQVCGIIFISIFVYSFVFKMIVTLIKSTKS